MTILSGIRSLFTLTKGVVRGLSEESVGHDPIALFVEWFGDAQRASILHPEAMTVATCSPNAKPSARIMLLKGVDERGFVFYTNHGSRKASELRDNPRVALVFHWAILERQVRVEGRVERLTDDESRAYFRTRPRRSQIGAWASRQSASLPERRELEERFKRYEARFREGEIPLPEFWGGYRTHAEQIEFWQGRMDRLHDRFRFERSGDRWIRTRLYP